MASAARAAHLIVDDPPAVFSDTLASALLGERAKELIGYHRAHGTHPVLARARAAATARSRYTEDLLAEEAASGRIGQYVVLGAGLDSFAYRSGLAARVRTFEVDRAATQRWKRDALARAGVAVPGSVAFVAADLEAEPAAGLLGRLEEAGFDASRPALVSWLGVTMYLSREAIGRTLAVVGGLAPGTELVADYLLPPELRDGAGRAYASAVSAVTAEGGEPWTTFLDPGGMSALLAEHGLKTVEHVRENDVLGTRADSLAPAELSMLVRARA
ncbi:SAM-dependent methyltransferase [Actinomadura sp. J1-007]|nr:SAM-dependent methyltransferase [Actinomadura sp. J1-007]